jgi:cell division protein FtsW (lipid II flippase)
VNSTDGRIDQKKKVLRSNLIIESLITVALFVVLAFIAGLPIEYAVIITLGFVAATIFSYYLLHDGFWADIAPVKVYSNGVENFSSPLLKLRGIDGFIDKSRMESIEVESYEFTGELGPKNHDQVMFFKNNKNVTLKLKNGKKKPLGRRFSNIVDEMTERMSKAWNVPVNQIERKFGKTR